MAVHDNGLNLQVLGYFEGTVDKFHLRHDASYKVGKKVKARVLYDFSLTPPKFALSLADHVLALDVRHVEDMTMEEAYPVGTIVESVKVSRTELERGLIVEVGDQPKLEGFVHVRLSQWSTGCTLNQPAYRSPNCPKTTCLHSRLPLVPGK
jgi:rRNA biogenesis protein RRP5